MVFLNRGYFYPMLIILSLVFLPMIALGILWLFYAEDFMPLVAITVVSIIYFSLLIMARKISKSSKYYLICHEDCLEINWLIVK